jgi:hypothetical protein
VEATVEYRVPVDVTVGKREEEAAAAAAAEEEEEEERKREEEERRCVAAEEAVQPPLRGREPSLIGFYAAADPPRITPAAAPSIVAYYSCDAAAGWAGSQLLLLPRELSTHLRACTAGSDWATAHERWLGQALALHSRALTAVHAANAPANAAWGECTDPAVEIEEAEDTDGYIVLTASPHAPGQRAEAPSGGFDGARRHAAAIRIQAVLRGRKGREELFAYVMPGPCSRSALPGLRVGCSLAMRGGGLTGCRLAVRAAACGRRRRRMRSGRSR